jgi:repressor LexA
MMARRRAKGLTERQKKIIEVVEKFNQDNGYPPAIREICDLTGISSTSVVSYYLDQLREKGVIERDGRVSRGIRLLMSADEAMEAAAGGVRHTAQVVKARVDEILRIAIAGRIVASAPVPVPGSGFNYFDAESMVEVARSMISVRDGDLNDLYALEVQGDSMIDAMVNDGDIVIMKPARDAYNGEMVAVWLDDTEETTLKFFYKEDKRVRLQPANPTMQPIYINDPKRVRIQGKVVMVIRSVGLPA